MRRRYLGLGLTLALCGFSQIATAQSLYVTVTDGIVKYAMDGTSTVFASGLTAEGPERMAFDHTGNLYMSGVYTGVIDKFTPGGQRTQFTSGIAYPDGLAFDATGNLYAASIVSGQVIKIAPDGTKTVGASGIANPFDVAFDSAGNMYISGSNGVYKKTPSGTQTTVASVPSLPGGNFVSLVLDHAGNIYLGDYNTGTIEKVTAGGAISTFASLPYSLEGMAIDNSGDIFAIAYNGGSSSIYKVTPDGTKSLFASGVDHPEGLAFYSPPSAETPEPGTIASLASLACAGGVFIIKRRK